MWEWTLILVLSYTSMYADPHIEKKVYIIMVLLIVEMIRINDFTIINLVHITSIGITLNQL